MTETSNATVIRDLAAAAVGTPIIAGSGAIPHLVVPYGYQISSMEGHLPTPARKRGKATFSSFASFVAYVKEHRNVSTRIFANTTNGFSLNALLDFHSDHPSWCEHNAIFNASLSPEWQRWKGMHGKPVNQAQLADFFERNVSDIVTPPGAQVLEIVENLNAKVDVRFENKIAVTDGKTRIVFEEDIKVIGGGSSTRPGQMDLPREITVALPVYQHEAKVQTKWRLRPSVSNKQLSFTIELSDLATVESSTANAYLERVVSDLEITPFIGSFESRN